MDNGSKKRKLSHDHVDVDVDEISCEEQKIEKFYALIKSMRDARDRLMLNNNTKAMMMSRPRVDDHHVHDNINNKLPMISSREVTEAAAWKPSFQREDFINNNNNNNGNGLLGDDHDQQVAHDLFKVPSARSALIISPFGSTSSPKTKTTSTSSSAAAADNITDHLGSSTAAKDACSLDLNLSL